MKMKIIGKIHQSRFDFDAWIVCEYCDDVRMLSRGYDDYNYHVNVIPKFGCMNCGKDRSGDGGVESVSEKN